LYKSRSAFTFGGRKISSKLGIDTPPKIPYSALAVRVLQSPDQISGFICNDSDLNEYLHNVALDAIHEGTATTHLVYYNDTVVGFFSLASGVINKKDVSEDDTKPGFGPVNYPTLLIARLATHIDWERRGIGTYMLAHSMAIAIHLHRHFLGCRFITVDAKRDRVSFYIENGFKLVQSTKDNEHPKLYFNHVELLKKLHGSDKTE